MGGPFDSEIFESEMGSDESFDLSSDEATETAYSVRGANESRGTPSKPVPMEAGGHGGGHHGGGHHGGGRGHSRHSRQLASISVPDNSVTVVNQPSDDAPSEPVRSKKLRTRPMPQTMRVKWPDVQTVLLTNTDGSQVMFVRT